MEASTKQMLDVIAKHSDLLDQFRHRLSDLDLEPYRKSDGFLINWLIHTGFDLKKSETLLRTTLIWRKEQKMDDILNEQYPDLTKTLPYEYLGFDKAGRPLIYLRFASWKLREVIESGQMEEALRYILQFFARIDQSLKTIFESTHQDNPTTDSLINQFILFIDFKDFSVYQLASTKSVKIMAEFAKTGETHYPNAPFKLLCVNASWVSRMFLKVISPFMSTATLSVLKLMGSNKEEWSKVLSQFIETKDLPVQYGGTRVSAPGDHDLPVQ